MIAVNVMKRFDLSEGSYVDNERISWWWQPIVGLGVQKLKFPNFIKKLLRFFRTFWMKGVLTSAIRDYFVEGWRTMGFLMLMVKSWNNFAKFKMHIWKGILWINLKNHEIKCCFVLIKVMQFWKVTNSKDKNPRTNSK